MPDKPQRRLAAIFVLDVSGFSRLMAEDEAGTLNQVLAQQQSLIAPAIRNHEGRIVKLMGDGVLAIFPSVISAVQAAAEVQAGAARNRHLQLRIGITLGEVMIARGDVYGDDVNIAARLEALAPLGGVALSAAAYGQVQGRIPYAFEDLGLHEVKNIPEPVHVYVLGQELTSLPSLRRSPRRPSLNGPNRARACGLRCCFWPGRLGPQPPRRASGGGNRRPGRTALPRRHRASPPRPRSRAARSSPCCPSPPKICSPLLPVCCRRR